MALTGHISSQWLLSSNLSSIFGVVKFYIVFAKLDVAWLMLFYFRLSRDYLSKIYILIVYILITIYM